jgi:transcriptional regulator with XRE-family HTH domain
MSNLKTLGNIFKRAREEKGLTQLDVAVKSGIHVNTYARFERGDQQPIFGTISKLAKVLGINLSDIPD